MIGHRLRIGTLFPRQTAQPLLKLLAAEQAATEHGFEKRLDHRGGCFHKPQSPLEGDSLVMNRRGLPDVVTARMSGQRLGYGLFCLPGAALTIGNLRLVGYNARAMPIDRITMFCFGASYTV